MGLRAQVEGGQTIWESEELTAESNEQPTIEPTTPHTSLKHNKNTPLSRWAIGNELRQHAKHSHSPLVFFFSFEFQQVSFFFSFFFGNMFFFFFFLKRK